jgi:hypothetical protein
LLTGMTGISLHMQWPLTSQLHGSVSQREQLVNIQSVMFLCSINSECLMLQITLVITYKALCFYVVAILSA